MNRQIRVGDFKNVIVFDPLLAGHVIRRMRSSRVRIFSGNKVGHVTRHAQQLFKVKKAKVKVKVTKSRDVSADKTL